MPRTENQYEKIRESKKKLIMDTALELFANQGYYPTSISIIAKKAGISKGLLYNYFKSKEDLIKEIINRGIDELLETFDLDRDGVLTEDEFDYLVHENFRLIKNNIQHWKLFFAISMQPPVFKVVKERISEFMPKYINIMAKYYNKRGVSNPVTEALFFGAVMDGVSLNYVADPDKFPLEEITQKIIDIFSHKNSQKEQHEENK
ncbi:MAG: TetR/AcrR family transcriptional regulator [Bacteroidetes bacterium]|nr:TetR/AcrR family transcriptional regulator [Bacteroidota bacterium]